MGIKATVTTVHQQTFNKSGIETTQQSLRNISSKTELDDHQQNSGCLPSKTGFQPANGPIPPATGLNAAASKAIGTSFIASKAWLMEKCLWISLMYQDSLTDIQQSPN